MLRNLSVATNVPLTTMVFQQQLKEVQFRRVSTLLKLLLTLKHQLDRVHWTIHSLSKERHEQRNFKSTRNTVMADEAWSSSRRTNRFAALPLDTMSL